MTRYRIIVAYDGTDFFGWQEQKEFVSVASALKQSFLKTFNRSIKITGASRTDAGVHALGQVAAFSTDLIISPYHMQRAWNHSLPASVSIQELAIVSDDYSPQHDVVQKTYKYTLFTKRPLPFEERYGWYYRWDLDVEKLARGLQVFVGTHDFRSFCTGDDFAEHKGTIRTIDSIDVIQKNDYTYEIVVKGPGFLRYMIRRIVGACIEVAANEKLDRIDLQKALQACNPAQTLPNAPAKGLMLCLIEYKKDVCS